jgi:hypothetical protein
VTTTTVGLELEVGVAAVVISAAALVLT